MLTKNLILAFSTFVLRAKPSPSKAQDHATAPIKKQIRAEVLAVGFRLLMGVVLCFITIFTMIRLEDSFRTYLSQFDNGILVELSVLSTITVVGAVTLYFLYKKKLPRPQSIDVLQLNATSIDLKMFAVWFLEGFIEGFESQQQKIT